MQLQNYYYWFKDAIPHHVCDDIVRYAKSIQDQMARLAVTTMKILKF